ncbi:lipopolysaccharide biosynthesis protein [Psychrobacter sp. W2-37-MNA-CIBAN-0211]|jgi:O-antigen/teichoic acid export membrane protein|uniref:lipopolysaccharide biosynthesis protein n=1 Tax=Psychrobacter sp. W2-37-MNA-CIBAN-0211 TaxID=3140443 RepID=UPI003329FFA7
MNDNQINRSLLLNTLWSFGGRFGYLAVGLITNIILVRLLSPREFGQVSIVMFFIVISTILIESGLSGALVRKQNTTETDYSTVFIFNLAISIVLMLGLLISAQYIADFYNDNELTNLLRMSSLVLFVNALRITQSVKLVKALDFKAKSYYEIIAIIVGSIIAIYAAAKGAGALSLVILQLSTAITLTGLLWFYVGSMKSYKFSIESFKQVYKFGINTTLASILDKAFDNSYQLILAKYFAISQSGYFYQAKKLQEMPIGIIQGSVLGVVYATLSRLQDNRKKFQELYFNIVKIFTIVVGFICIIIFYYSELIIQILYGREWLTSATYLQLLILASFFYLQEIFNRILFKIFNRTDLILKLEFFKKLLLTITIVYGIKTLSISNLLYGFIVVSAISFFINYHYARKIYTLPYWIELNIILKVVLISTITILFNMYIANIYELQGVYSLFLFPIITLAYLALLIVFKVVSVSQDLQSIKKIFKKGKSNV